MIDKETINSRINNFENIHRGVTRFMSVMKACSVLDSLVYVINSIKALGFGIAWKSILKAFPSAATVDESLNNFQSSIQNLMLPIGTLQKTLLPVIATMKQLKDGDSNPTNLSAQLYAVLSSLTELQPQLIRLNNLINNIHKVMNGFDSLIDKLKSVKGIGSLTTKLQESYAAAIDYFNKLKSSNEELSSTIDATMAWLPEYQKSTRQIVTATIFCQSVISQGLFKKELCQKSVTWFSDEAEAVCSQCGIHLCGQHRIAAPTPIGSSIRNTWYCLNCIKKINK